jgi:16S rRNA (adenine1518-N6/adenine1519-N6)-dimethyltransferase
LPARIFYVVNFIYIFYFENEMLFNAAHPEGEFFRSTVFHMKRGEIIDTCNAWGIHPSKRFGQNFLCNRAILNRIVDGAGINGNDRILEIGPGLGVLTEALAERAHAVRAVEIDSGLVRYLRERFRDSENIEIIHADFLKYRGEGEFTKSVSNLPYYCSSEILFRTATEYHMDVFAMLQREMADRIVSEPGSRSYGALTVTLSFYYETVVLFKVNRNSFYPQPDVASSFIRLTRRDDRTLTVGEIELFHRIVKSAFWGRRKKLLNALSESPHLDIQRVLVRGILKDLNIDEGVRGEELTLEQFKELSRVMYAYKGE